jgi:hypothetical protein
MFYCDTCDIKTNNKFDFNRHLVSPKHQRLCSENLKCKNYIHSLISGGSGGSAAKSIPQKPTSEICDAPTPQKTPINEVIQINLHEEDEENNVVYHAGAVPGGHVTGGHVTDATHAGAVPEGHVTGGHVTDATDATDPIGHVTGGHVTDTTAYECKYCKRPYINRTGLWRHNKKFGASCVLKIMNESKLENTAELKNMINTMMHMNHEFKTQIMDLYKTAAAAASSAAMTTSITNNNNNNTNNMNNCYNQTFNMNLFLNEQCKDAMNMKDFVNSIQLDTDDLESVGKLGYVEGISNILITKLNKTEIHKRPVHCSDIKRETLYVKDADKWEREGPDHAKMVKAVLAVEHKNVSLMGEWAARHPRCMDSNTKENAQYFKLSKTVTDGAQDGNISKIIKRVAKNVLIDKGMTQCDEQNIEKI